MKLRIFFLMLVCNNVFAERNPLPPVVDNSTYPANIHGGKTSVNQSVYETMARLAQLQNEVQQLRGEVEEQAYTILELKKRIKNIYADFDQRVEKLEGGGLANQSPAPSQPLVKQQAALPPTKVKPKLQKNEKQHYQQAYESLRNGHYSLAIQEFQHFLTQFPAGQYAANAQYWLGEAYKVSQNNKAARKEFKKVLSDYPNSSKVPDAILKLGYLELERRNKARARDYLTDVTVKFPGTTAAHLAAKKLEQINK